MAELQTHDELEVGDEVEFTYVTKVMNNRVTKSGEVVEVGGDVVKIEVDDTDPFEGASDVFALLGNAGLLKDVFYIRDGQKDTFCGDRGRIA